ncbi:MAG: hypothetical protein IJZ90_00620, partial [Clostridia bacterium]|nr:hypothetical protein [Clostridia bacterium]
MLSKKVEFAKAVPVWADGLEKEMNISVLFCGNVHLTAACEHNSDAVLRVTGSSAYFIRINGDFFATGPARAGHGHYRVDKLPIGELLKSGDNKIEILVAGYNSNSFYWLDQPSFLCAEIIARGTPVLWTAQSDNAADGSAIFKAYIYNERTVKVQRYSFQRNFAEVYDFSNKTDFTNPVKLINAEAEKKVFIERGIFYPKYEKQHVESVVCSGKVSFSEKESYYSDRAI